jgi:O-phosphoseryl-tRNA(Cys) synthetase
VFKSNGAYRNGNKQDTKEVFSISKAMEHSEMAICSIVVHIMNNFKIIRNIQTGLKSLRLHLMRSFLTTLGVVFGAGSVIVLLAW